MHAIWNSDLKEKVTDSKALTSYEVVCHKHMLEIGHTFICHKAEYDFNSSAVDDFTLFINLACFQAYYLVGL